MDTNQFDSLTRLVGRALPRRAVPPLLGGIIAPLLLDAVPALGKKKKKVTLCLDGQTIQASKKKKKKLLKSGATPGECPPPSPPPPPPGCTPQCSGTTCGGDDGCGGTCGCAADSICHGGVCQKCSVACPGDGVDCGNALQATLNGGGTIYICPGRYVGNFQLGSPTVVLIGAGDGDDQTKDTILDANGSGRVVEISPNVNATLRRLRVTGGNVTNSDDVGMGVFTVGTLTMTACTVTNNRARLCAGVYAFNTTGPLTLNDCTISENTATGNEGGGVCVSIGSGSILGTSITGNDAATSGGGLGVFQGASVKLNSASSVTGNTAGTDGGGIYVQADAGVQLNGATVSGNSIPQCTGVTCPGT